MEKSGGFDMAKITTASKIVMVAGILLLVDSFLSWQKVCFDTGVLGDICAKANAWGGNGGWAGVIMGILLIILLIWEGTQLAEMPMNLSIGVTPTKGTAYLGFAVVIIGVAEVHLRDHERGLAGGLDRTRPAHRDRVRLMDEVPGARDGRGPACVRRQRRWLHRLILRISSWGPVAEGDRAPVVPASRLG